MICPSRSACLSTCHVLLVYLFCCGLGLPSVRAADTPWEAVAMGRVDLSLRKEGQPGLLVESVIRGPGWAPKNWNFATNLPEVKDGKTRSFQATVDFAEGVGGPGAEPLKWEVEYTATRSGPDSIECVYELTPNRAFRFGTPKGGADSQGTVSMVVSQSSFLEGGKCVLETVDGTSKEISLPPGMGSAENIKAATLVTSAGENVRMEFDPPTSIHTDAGEVRFMLASSGEIAAGETSRHAVTIRLPGAVTFSPENRWVDTSDWFPIAVDNDFSKPSEIGMADWLEKPAGKRGFLRMEGDKIVHGDGTPFKLWGTNVLRVDNRSINKEYLSAAAAACEFYGININRLHAFAKPHDKKWAHMFKLMDPEDSFLFHEGHLELFDHVFAEFKKRGIYTGWSVFYGWFPTAADKEQNRLIDWDEAQTMLRKPFPREGSWYGATAVMPDVQELIIKWHVKLLGHVNQFTGIRYADDPALAFVELQNEENAWLQIRDLERMLADAPTYRKLFYERFAKWLKEKYGDDEALKAAWGTQMRTGETLAEANITPFPVWYNAASAPGQRIADQYLFIYHTQHEYYQKFKAAVREAGYGGLLVGSCWQAADWLGHLYNTLLDAEVGMIDRHNYGRDHLDKPGTGLLSAGFQQVADRPFNYSEWGGDSLVGQSIIEPITAFYGMGLQGWDGSQQFAWDFPGIIPRTANGINETNNDFRALAQYPALARSVHRGDVREGAVAGLRKVSLPALKEKGYVGFHEEFSLLGNANHKSFRAAVPQQSLAVGRVLMEFVDGPVEQPVVDHTAGFLDPEKRIVRSNTGQLLWNYSGAGWFSVDTDGTKAVVGYAKDTPVSLGIAQITSRSPYATIYVSALGKGETLADSKRMLITTIGRGVNRGVRFEEFAAQAYSLPANNEPKNIVIEPVVAEVSIERDGDFKAFALDHHGRMFDPPVEIPVKKSAGRVSVLLDGNANKTVYYLLTTP